MTYCTVDVKIGHRLRKPSSGFCLSSDSSSLEGHHQVPPPKDWGAIYPFWRMGHGHTLFGIWHGRVDSPLPLFFVQSFIDLYQHKLRDTCFMLVLQSCTILFIFLLKWFQRWTLGTLLFSLCGPCGLPPLLGILCLFVCNISFLSARRRGFGLISYISCLHRISQFSNGVAIFNPVPVTTKLLDVLWKGASRPGNPSPPCHGWGN